MKKSNQLFGFRLCHLFLPFFSLVTLTASYQEPAIASSQPYLSSHGINFAIGNKYHKDTDVSIITPTGTLSFSRYYNSMSSKDGVLGYRWTHSFSDHIEISPDEQQIRYTAPNGRAIDFLYNAPSDTWIKEVGKSTFLVKVGTDFELKETNGRTLQFGADGALKEIRDRVGNTITCGYTANNLTSVSNAFGQSFTLAYNTDGRLEALNTPVGIFSYTYDQGDLTEVRKPGMTTPKEYHYTNHNLISIVDETGTERISVSYTDGRVTGSTIQGGYQSITIEYPSEFVRRVIDANNSITTYNLSAKNGIAFIDSYDGPGCTTCGTDNNASYTYNERYQLASSINGIDTTTTYTYDENGNKDIVTEAAGTPEARVTDYDYNLSTNLLEHIHRDSVANPGETITTSMTYYPNGNLHTRTENGWLDATTPMSRTTTYEYTDYGQISSIDGPREDVTDVTTFTYYPNTAEEGLNRGFLHTVINSLGHTVTYSEYNAHGKPERIVDANSIVTVLDYDDVSGNLLTQTTGSRTVSYEYDHAGRLDLITMSPGNRVLDYVYDSTSGKLDKIIDSRGNYIQYQYDPVTGKQSGRLIYESDATLRFSASYEFDVYGRLHKSIHPVDLSFSELQYDGVGNTRFRIDEEGRPTEYIYDALSRLVNILGPGETAGVPTYVYDSHDNTTTVNGDNGTTTTYTYDDFGRRTTQTSPDTGQTSYLYDKADNLIAKTDAEQVTVSYSYDALHRLKHVVHPVTFNTVSYVYDLNPNGIGRLSTVTDSSGTTEFLYNQYGEIEETTKTTSYSGFTTSYSYNDYGELKEMTYPSGRTVTYKRNIDGVVESVETTYQGSTEVVGDNITNRPFGPVTTITLGNGIEVSHGYDLEYRRTTSIAGTLYNTSYEYWPTSEVKTITDNLDTAKTQYFHYDDLGRLDSAEGVYGTRTYGYDLLGNRQTLNAPGGSTTYQYTSGTNRLERTTGAINKYQSYDANGRVFSLGWLVFPNFYKNDQISFVFIGNNRPIARYSYNYQKQRVEKYTGGLNTFYHYDKDGHLIEETDRYGTPITTYIRLAGEPLAQVNHDGAIYYYHNDHLGTPQLLSDVSGSTAWAADYLPFGDASISVESVTNNLRFAGQYYDWETGLHYNWNRYYDPETGRYVSADPIGLDGGMNLYAYVENNPVNWVDPLGLKLRVSGSFEERQRMFDIIQGMGCGQLTMDGSGNIYGQFDDDECSPCNCLKQIINSSKDVRVGFSEEAYLYGGGSWDGDTATASLAPEYKQDGQTYYTFAQKPRSWREWLVGGPQVPYHAEGALAHELLGHACDFVNGDNGQHEQRAQDQANRIRRTHGWPERYR